MLKPFDYWPVWLQCVAVHVMRTSVSLWREQGALSFYFKSRRWSQCGQGAGLVLTAQAQKTPWTVNPCVSTATGVNCHSPCTFTDSLVRATGWAAVWQDPFKQVLPRVALDADFSVLVMLWVLFKCGLWAQLILMATSSLFSLFLCEWLLWSSSPSLCHFALCVPLHKSRLQGPYLCRSFFSDIFWLNSNSKQSDFTAVLQIAWLMLFHLSFVYWRQLVPCPWQKR